MIIQQPKFKIGDSVWYMNGLTAQTGVISGISVDPAPGGLCICYSMCDGTKAINEDYIASDLGDLNQHLSDAGERMQNLLTYIDQQEI